MENRFPKIWVPSGENRDLRQLLWPRHRMVQMRTRIMNQLQVVALQRRAPLQKEVVAKARTRTTGVVSLSPLGEPTTGRSAAVAGSAEPTIADLTQMIEQEVEKCPEARRLRTHPGVGALKDLGNCTGRREQRRVFGLVFRAQPSRKRIGFRA
jgi:transposase